MFSIDFFSSSLNMSWKEISVVNILAQRIHYHCGLEVSFLESHRSENTNPCHLLTYRVNHWGLSKEVWWSRLLCRGWQALGRQLWRLKFPFLSGRIYVGSLWRRRQTEQIDCTCRSTVWMRWTSLGVIFNSTKQGKTGDYKTVFVPGEWRDMHSQIFLLSPDTLGALIDWFYLLFFERVAQVDLQLNVGLRLTLDSPDSPVPASWMLQLRACPWVCFMWCMLSKPSANWVTVAGHRAVSNYVSIPFFKIWRCQVPSA